MASSSSEERRPEERFQQPSPPSPPSETVKECVYKTKLVEFWGRTTPIVLQNDNGPCPLLAICNVLLLKNDLNLSPDTTEVSQEKLLSLVAERLIDSNSNTKDKGEGYAENQQQNISDAIDLLPRLATGIDVNIKFRRIRDFEFTPECAIFDLLDIPLYHGWIVDPQDYETASAIGSKSYNSLMEELVALETRNDGKYENVPVEDCVDFAAATTATLGVPSPCLSKAISFDDSSHFESGHQDARKGDLEEETELLRALKISESESPPSLRNPHIADESTMKVDSFNTLEKHTVKNKDFLKSDQSVPDDSNGSPKPEVNLFLMVSEGNNLDPSKYVELDGKAPVFDVGQVGSSISLSPERKVAHEDEHHSDISGSNEKLDNLGNSTTDINENAEKKCAEQNADLNSDSSSGRIPSEALASSEGEPLYEGEDCIMEPGTLDNEVREAMYEGEVVLANQADKSTLDLSSKDEHSIRAGELIKSFLRSNASQLTIYGLFCLQEGLKDRELCVFFRNNHFSTMYKTSGELYLLATDLGYISQTELVWEKLNEVNGDTLFVTGNFKEFKAENHSSDSWSEHSAMSSTAEYIASIDSAAQAGMDINPDLQFAIALQQQEMDEQQQRQNPPQPQPQPQPHKQQSITGPSRLITGPHGPRSSGRPSSSYRPDPKPKEKDKEKCTVM